MYIYVYRKWYYFFFILIYLLGTSTISHRKALQCQAGREITKVAKNQQITLPSYASEGESPPFSTRIHEVFFMRLAQNFFLAPSVQSVERKCCLLPPTFFWQTL